MTYLSTSRRKFLKGLTATSVLSATAIPAIALPGVKNELDHQDSSAPGSNATRLNNKPELYDGPSSPMFKMVPLKGNHEFSSMKQLLSGEIADAVEHAPVGQGTAWGIPFNIPEKGIVIKDKVFSFKAAPFIANWLLFLHTSDTNVRSGNQMDQKQPVKGPGQLNEHVADYIIIYKDKTEERVAVKERHHIGMYRQGWGENSIQSVAHHKPKPVRAHHEQMNGGWGYSQTRANSVDRGEWINWVWALENPHPDKEITGFRFEPLENVTIVISAISAGHVLSNPLRWRSRRKALFVLPGSTDFDPQLDPNGLLSQVQLDLGQIISATPRLMYTQSGWSDTYNNKLPEESANEILIEYTSHPEARFHLHNKKLIPVSEIEIPTGHVEIKPVNPAAHKVKIRIIEKGTNNTVPVKLHVHGESDEYLAPVDRHRIPNDAWFEDYSVDFIHGGKHICTYISGETTMKLPYGMVYFEISKGFEIRPVRKAVEVTRETDELIFEIEKVLPWREKGWVSADTHVHFLSPNSALLEGSAEGVNIVNLLASQWGELFTNLGDFDDKTTIGSKDSGGDGEYLVRVGTENRQHVLGHISLLGYNGDIINPLTTGGPAESALGDPIEILLTEWAEQCKKQGGVVILPHFPNPRLENAAAIVSGNVDGVEMTSWGSLYYGIDPYSLADWYRYLNCGYFVAAVGGTDKMSAGTAVGTIRTYAKTDENSEFTYDAWKISIRSGNTFVTYGPLLEFSVDGKPMGSRIKMTASAGTVDVTWKVASVTIPMSRVELIVNGEVKESIAVSPENDNGSFSVKINKSSWLALLVRGHYPDKHEIITAHSSPVMINVEGSTMMVEMDAITILEQIEGSLAYIDTIGTQADEKSLKRMRLVLESAHRDLHNRMHQLGQYHNHSPLKDHPEHGA